MTRMSGGEAIMSQRVTISAGPRVAELRQQLRIDAAEGVDTRDHRTHFAGDLVEPVVLALGLGSPDPPRVAPV